MLLRTVPENMPVVAAAGATPHVSTYIAHAELASADPHPFRRGRGPATSGQRGPVWPLLGVEAGPALTGSGRDPALYGRDGGIGGRQLCVGNVRLRRAEWLRPRLRQACFRNRPQQH